MRLLIDGHNFIWRGFIKFNEKSEIGEDWTLIFNFFRNLRAIKENFNPCKIYFFLEGHPQFRYDLDINYKSNRKNTNTNFHRQKNKIIELLEYLPIEIIKPTGFECDDAISTFANNDDTIVSNDSDFIQILPRAEVKLYSAHKKEYVDPTSYNYLNWKALAGDKSDNIKNIVGPKTALKLVNNSNELEKFLLDEDNKKAFNRNIELIQFREVPNDCLKITTGKENFIKLKEEFNKLEFKSLVEEKYWTRFESTFQELTWSIDE